MARPWLLAGLAFGLLGDVALMLGNDQHAAGAIENSARATGDHGRATGEDGRATGEGEALDTADTGGPDLAFIAGLGAFLVGHLFYLVAFVRVGVHPFDVLLGVIVAAAVAVVALPPVLRGAVRAEGRAFAGIVAVYAGLLAAMTALAVGTAVALTALGGVLFLVSDTLLARGRFVGPVRHGALLVIVTYHVAQLLIVIGVIRTT